jgi:AcrR family transcriptional regulator
LTQSDLDLPRASAEHVGVVKKIMRKSLARPRSDGRREQIVNAALQVMIAEGVYHATTRKIASAAGVNVATLHYHFHDKEEITFSVMEVLASNYRETLAARFSTAQTLHDRIGDLLRFIFSEIEKSRGEQLVLQEMTLYVLRYPHAEHLAAEKEREIQALYLDMLRATTDVRPEDEAELTRLTNFIYASFVGILNQWLASHDARLLLRTTDDLIEAAQAMAARRITGARKDSTALKATSVAEAPLVGRANGAKR